MWRMLIADDEEIECRGLEMKIQNNFHNIELLPSAYNGVSLIKAAQELQPDMMIVDINMPGLNGLEALELLHLKSFSSKVIINTAYSDFEYIKKALLLGAVDYLVKPAEERQLVETVSRVIGTLEQERRTQFESKMTEEKFQNMQRIVGNELMSSILLGKPNEADLKIWFDNLDRTYFGGILVAMRIADQKKNQNVYLEMIRKLLDEELKRFCTFLSMVYKDTLYLFLFPAGQVGRDNYHSWTRELLNYLKKKIQIEISGDVIFGVSQWKYEFEKMPEALKECKSSLRNLSEDGICFFEEECYAQVQRGNEEKEAGQLAEFVKAGNRDQGKILLAKKIAQWKEAGIWQENQLLVYFLLNCSKMLQEQESKHFSWRQILTRLKDTGEKDRIDTALDILCEIAEPREIADRANSYVEEAVLYIEQNYMKDISLELVAGRLGISSFYLSRLLTQQLDESFTEILTDTRIDHAIELIRRENFMVKDIGRRVGYLSDTYFYKVFKKNTGMTVGEMRQLLKGE